MQAIRLLIVLIISSCSWLSATVIGTSVAAQPLTAERVSSLPKQQTAVWKEYMERSARQHKADQAFLAAELKQAGMSAPLVPPTGRTGRLLSLDRPAEWYGGAEARRIADIVVSFQTPAGGWSKNLDLTAHARRKGEGFAANSNSVHLTQADFDAPGIHDSSYVGTIDNDGTVCELRFLAKVAAALEAKAGAAYRASFLKGLNYVFAAQYPNGGWPQVWPLQGGYHDAVTFNDNAMVNVLELLESVAAGNGDFKFVPQAVRARARASVERGVKCILAAQIVDNGKLSAWGQQHDMLTLRPVAARNYEPASECSAESARLVLFLMRRPNPSAEIVRAVEAAIAWLRKTAIYDAVWTRKNTSALETVKGAGPLWARYYEIGSDRPIFGDRDKTIHDRIGDISEERRRGYAWYNNTASEALNAYATWSHPQLPH